MLVILLLIALAHASKTALPFSKTNIKYLFKSLLPYHLYTLEVEQASLKDDRWYHFQFFVNDAESTDVEIAPKRVSGVGFENSEFSKKFADGVIDAGTEELAAGFE